MSRLDKTIELVKAGELVLESYVYIDTEKIQIRQEPIDLDSLYQVIQQFPDTADIDSYFDLAQGLLRPVEQLYSKYREREPDGLTEDQFYILTETGIADIETVAYYYVYVQTKLQKIPKTGLTIEQQRIQDQIITAALNYINQQNAGLSEDLFRRRVEDFTESFERQLAEFRGWLEVKQRLRSDFSDIKEDVEFVEQTILRSFLAYECETDLDELEHLNQARVSHLLPYLTVHPYTKIFQGSKVYTQEWNTKKPDALVGYVKTGVKEAVTSYSQFQLMGNTLVMESRARDIDIENPGAFMKGKITQSLSGLTIGRNTLEEISVECFIADFTVNTSALKHFLCTDPVMKYFYFLDESSIIERKREFITLYYYSDLTNKQDPPIVITINNRNRSTMSTVKLKNNRCHTRIYIKRCSRQKLDSTLHDLSRCFTKFMQAQQEINEKLSVIPYYKSNLSALNKRCEPSEDAKPVTLLAIFPNQSGLRSVQQGFIGVLEKINTNRFKLINPLDAPSDMLISVGAEVEPKKQVLIYPKRSDQGRGIPTYGYFIDEAQKEAKLQKKLAKAQAKQDEDQSDAQVGRKRKKRQPEPEEEEEVQVQDEAEEEEPEEPERRGTKEPRVAVKTQYIGLKYDYALDPPYLPASFDVDQVTTKTGEPAETTLNKYLSGNDEPTKPETYHLIKTSKFVGKNRVGVMLDDVNRWVTMTLPGYDIFRFGLYNFDNPGHVEFIHKEHHHASVLYVLGRATGMIRTGEYPKVREMKAELVKIIDEQNDFLSEIHGYSKSDLKNILEDNLYIDPRLFYHILTRFFGVDIMLFTNDKREEHRGAVGKAFYPCAPYYHTPLSYQPQYDRFVTVAINHGTEFDINRDPICEICFLTLKNFEEEKKAYPSIKINEDDIVFPYQKGSVEYALFDDYREQIIGKQFGIEVEPYEFKTRLTGQSVDSYGRVRWLHFGQVHAQLLVPQHSNEYPVEDGDEFWNEEDPLDDFLSRDVPDQVIYRKSEADEFLGVVAVFSKPDRDPYRYYFPMRKVVSNELSVYRKTEKIARYLQEYAYRAFSLYIKEKEEINYTEFAQNHFIMVVNHKYNDEALRQWTVEDQSYLYDGKIIVTSDTMKTKLMYLIRQKFQTNANLMRSYYELPYMPNFYASTSDFTIMEKTVMVDRPYQSVEMEEGSFSIKPSASPYILYRSFKEFTNSKWLCQPADSLEHAIWIADEWRKKSYNPTTSGEAGDPCILIQWADSESYRLDGDDPSRIVSEIRLPDGRVTYQAMLPYLIM